MGQFSKYDRQLRMWGTEGQAGLRSSKICLLNGSALGTEILKNLVLPGIASFTVVDGKMVTAADQGNNFFVTEADVGRPRAQAVTEALQELNPDDVEGRFVHDDPVQVMSSRPDFFNTFTLVIATDLREADCKTLGELCRGINVPLITCRTYGFYGVLCISGGIHTIVESKPDFAMDDMRLSSPFPAFLEAVASTDLGTLDDHACAHVPYPLLLHVLLKKWVAEKGAVPKAYPEKKEFKRFVAQSARSPDAVNFEEAANNSHKLFNKPSMTSNTASVIQSPLCDTETSPFWITMRAVREFYKEKDSLPLTGVLPDVTATPERYQALQSMYKAEAKRNAADVFVRAKDIAAELQPCGEVSEDYVAKVCRNIHDVAYVDFGAFQSWDTLSLECLRDIAQEMKNGGGSQHVLLGAWACEHFFQKHLRLPGQVACDEEEITLFKASAHDFASSLSAAVNLPEDLLEELCRSSSSEIHTTAAVLGGVAAQEVIKLVTNQYVPVDNCFIFDGVNGATSTVKLQ